MRYVALTGPHGAGKDTIARHLELRHKFAPIVFAMPLKGAASAITGEPFMYYDDRELKGQVEEISGRTRREIVNLLGDAVLEIFGREGLIKLADRKRRTYERLEPEFHGIVFTDVIGELEAQYVRQLGAQLWRINRPSLPSIGNHRTDAVLEHGYCDRVIENVGSVKDLLTTVDRLLEQEVA